MFLFNVEDENESTLYTRIQEGILHVLPVGSRSNKPPWKHKTTEIEAKFNPLLDVSARPRCCFILASRGHFMIHVVGIGHHEWLVNHC